MKGSTVKRCGCAPEYDSKGRRKACPKKHGSWSYVIDVGRDPGNGKRRQLRKSGFRTQGEAAAAMAEVMATVRQGQYRYDDRQTVETYLRTWLEAKSATLRPSTLGAYEQHVREYLIPKLGRVRLRELQPGHISKMLRDLKTEPRAEGRRPLSDSTLRRVHSVLRSALSDAKRERLISNNPALDATVPRGSRPKINPWEPSDLGAFLDYVADKPPWGPMFELMAMTGLRRGEAIGLRWVDVNVTDGLLVVRQQLTQVSKHLERPCSICGQLHPGLLFGPPKTASGDARIVDLGEAAVGVLLEQRLRVDADREKWAEAYVDHDLVFAHENGMPWRPDNVTQAFTRLRERSGLRKVRLHDLRHGRASILLATGTDIALVSKMLGHSSISVTADTYSHLLAGVGRAASDRADATIPRRVRDQSVTTSPSETTEALSDSTGKGP